ncbi:hypothetical protein HWV62_42062 [Athelia sp. TMB]|nr:hypothetical protein HWV62_42062 [Athelia sp. TMB]
MLGTSLPDSFDTLQYEAPASDINHSGFNSGSGSGHLTEQSPTLLGKVHNYTISLAQQGPAFSFSPNFDDPLSSIKVNYPRGSGITERIFDLVEWRSSSIYRIQAAHDHGLEPASTWNLMGNYVQATFIDEELGSHLYEARPATCPFQPPIAASLQYFQTALARAPDTASRTLAYSGVDRVVPFSDGCAELMGGSTTHHQSTSGLRPDLGETSRPSMAERQLQDMEMPGPSRFPRSSKPPKGSPKRSYIKRQFKHSLVKPIVHDRKCTNQFCKSFGKAFQSSSSLKAHRNTKMCRESLGNHMSPGHL